MLAGVLIAAKKIEKNIGENFFLEPFFEEMDFEFHSPYQKHIKGFFLFFSKYLKSKNANGFLSSRQLI